MIWVDGRLVRMRPFRFQLPAEDKAMARYLILCVLIVIAAGAAAAPHSDDSLKIIANARGVQISTDEFSATAAIATYDGKSGHLVLEGSDESPVVINKGEGASASVLKALKIELSLKSGKVAAQGIRELRTDPPRQSK
jgi:hypothetical protein